ncbi:2-oxo acid dehydrogenase subunit E2 [Desulfosarcina ovata]|uniref:Dihydrolipoamide acetyltransferase component of pyruvate dehydrogenase complex n=1 Tax=Desulfosarcina ovata subsp. ovata TaxID=2752305 RepID=A0A5K8AEQ4_9BACT|nr:2-oxo acid dehydrogenase subunit E2 [Desulfosarcina ovata]BBO91122.1 hypothetical protein DSCOOX_43020 [Desulfosarcina ovata subsp. ovata]
MTEAIKVPEIGENVEAGVVVAVHIKEGDTIAVDDTVIELETDKALVEIPSPFAGRITEVLARPGAQMKVGDVIARLETETAPLQTENEAADGSPADTGEVTEATEPGTVAPTKPAAAAVVPEAPATDRSPVPAAPSTRRIARELGVDIYTVQGSGPGGRISEADVKAHVRRRMPEPAGHEGTVPSADTAPHPDFSQWGPVEVKEMETVRRLTAQSTTTGWSTIPHVTQFDEADISGVMAFIEKNAARAEQAGARLTLTAILTRVAAEALKRFPRFNASIDVASNWIILKKYIHIGIAAETPRGLLIPVVRDADRKSILELAGAIGDLTSRARSKKIKPDEMQGGTFTISNQGGIGGVGFTPLVLWPQVAVLGVSRSSVRPVYIKDRFEPRTILPLSLSYDHRMLDGADAARFLRWICEGLEQPLALFFE